MSDVVDRAKKIMSTAQKDGLALGLDPYSCLSSYEASGLIPELIAEIERLRADRRECPGGDDCTCGGAS